MSNPFANGSSIAQPMSTRPSSPPQAIQPADQYFGQSYRNLGREEQAIAAAAERGQLLQRGRDLAGFVQRDRRAENRGFVWERQRGASWPAEMPAAAAGAVEQAINADHTARASLASADMSYQLWAREHPSATPERARVKYDELTEDLLPAAQRAAEQLDLVLVDAARLVSQIEQWHAVEQAAPGRRAAAERQYQQALNQVDTDLMVARQAVQRAGVKL